MADRNLALHAAPSQTAASQPDPKVVASSTMQTIATNNFDFCRFWLAILVIFAHSFALAEGDERHEPMGLLTSGQLGAGRFAVCCFFAISGFLISHSWLRSTTAASFLWKRVKRIYPAFIVAVALGVFVISPIASGSTLTLRQLLMLPINLLALRGCEPSLIFEHNPFPGALNGSLWTIPYEFKSYLALMALGGLGLLNNRTLALPCLLVATVLGSVAYPYYHLTVLERGAIAALIGQATAWFDVLPYFLTGAVFYQYRARIPLCNRYAACSALALACAALLPPLGRIVFPFAITYLLFWFSFHPLVRFHNWARHGDFSYGIYLYAFPIQQLIAMTVPGISPMLMFAAATPLAVLSGLLSWHIVEKHFMRARDNRCPLRSSSTIASQVQIPCLTPQ
jgi:peptidoglycan/LPS O-acetylase OafA/YrhL